LPKKNTKDFGQIFPLFSSSSVNISFV